MFAKPAAVVQRGNRAVCISSRTVIFPRIESDVMVSGSVLLAASGGPHRPGCVCLVRLCCLGLLVGGPGTGPAVADDNTGGSGCGGFNDCLYF